MVVTFVRESVRVWRPSGFGGFYLHTELLFSTGSPSFPFQDLGFLRESFCGKYLFLFQRVFIKKNQSRVLIKFPWFPYRCFWFKLSVIPILDVI